MGDNDQGIFEGDALIKRYFLRGEKQNLNAVIDDALIGINFCDSKSLISYIDFVKPRT